jgi:mono/diheme cytochrome c family protein
MTPRFPLGFGLCLIAVLLAAPAGAEDALPGKTTYEQLCVNCHGTLGKGDGPGGLTAYPVPRDFSVGEFKFDADSDGETGTDADLTLVIRDGAARYGGSPLMAPWGHLSEAQLAELLAYIRSLRVTK